MTNVPEHQSGLKITVAACGFAALLYKIVTSGAVSDAVSGLIKRALGAV